MIEGCQRPDLKGWMILTYDNEEDLKVEDINSMIVPVWKWLLLEGIT
jgi:hypothetical protein